MPRRMPYKKQEKPAPDVPDSESTATPCATCDYLLECQPTVLYTLDDPFCWPDSPRNHEYLGRYGETGPGHGNWSFIAKINELGVPLAPRVSLGDWGAS